VLRVELERVARALGDGDVDFVLERPRDDTHGDLATNLALTLAKRRRSNPRAVAEEVLRELQAPASLIAKTEIAGPGFINFWFASDTLAALHARILAEGARYGRSRVGEGVKVNLEFVSVNTTGPLHAGGGRWVAVGDAIANLLAAQGAQVHREYYRNDAGTQLDLFGASLLARYRGEEVPEDGYRGAYLGLAGECGIGAGAEGRALLTLPKGIKRSRELALEMQRGGAG
jgi:arginyl-tRNA synthetase